MTKDESFAMVKAQVLDKIESWSDVYEFFDEVMKNVTATMHPGMVFDAMFTMYAFIHALRELPEEGDIKKIVERMLRILIYESDEKLGAHITIMTADEVNAVLQSKIVEAAAAQAVQAGVDADEAKGKTRLLH